MPESVATKYRAHAQTSSPCDELKAAKWGFAFDVAVRTENLEARIHALERVPSEGRGKAAQLVPARFIFRNKLTPNDKLLMAFDALVLSEMIGREVGIGKIIHGDDHAGNPSKWLLIGAVLLISARVPQVIFAFLDLFPATPSAPAGTWLPFRS